MENTIDVKSVSSYDSKQPRFRVTHMTDMLTEKSEHYTKSKIPDYAQFPSSVDSGGFNSQLPSRNPSQLPSN